MGDKQFLKHRFPWIPFEIGVMTNKWAKWFVIIPTIEVSSTWANRLIVIRLAWGFWAVEINLIILNKQ